MSIPHIQAQMQSQVGSIIQSFCLEFWADAPHALDHLIGVGIEFRDGVSLILCCAGDGGIAVRKGKLDASTDNLHLRTFDRVSGMVISSIEFGSNSVTLSTRDHQIKISNHDDELEITVNGSDVKEFLDDSAGGHGTPRAAILRTGGWCSYRDDAGMDTGFIPINWETA